MQAREKEMINLRSEMSELSSKLLVLSSASETIKQQHTMEMENLRSKMVFADQQAQQEKARL